MARQRYLPLSASQLYLLGPVVPVLRDWRTRVKPFGPEYLAIAKIMQGMNDLAAATNAPPIFPPAGPPTAY